MKTKLFLLFILIAVMSCNNPQNPTNNTKSDIAVYAGTYTGTAKYNTVPPSHEENVDITLIVNEDGSVIVKTKDKDHTFSSMTKDNYNSYYYQKNGIVLSIGFDGKGNANLDFTIQDGGPQGTSVKYIADKLTKS